LKYRTQPVNNNSFNGIITEENHDTNGMAVEEDYPKRDYSQYEDLPDYPVEGSLIAFKLLELSNNQPEISNYKEGIVLSFDSITNQLTLKLNEEVITLPKDHLIEPKWIQ
jgi:hypothetical protein